MQPAKKLVTQKQIDGREAEEIAALFLAQQGLVEVERNARCGRYEIDLIFRDTTRIHFVEVRYRKNDCHGGAATTITPSKLKKCILAAQLWLRKHNLEDSYFQLDVVAIDGALTSPSLHWITNITL